MKKLLITIIAITAISCTSEDNAPLVNCDAAKAEINARFDVQVKWVKENTSPVDNGQINLINKERFSALETACE